MLNRRHVRTLFLLTLAVAAAAQTRSLESVVASLDYGSGCTSTFEARNLTDQEVIAEIQAHKTSGALILLSGQTESKVRIPRRGRASFQLDVPGEAGSGWVRVRESGSPALAISGKVECLDGDRLVTSVRDVVYSMRRPWFAGDVADLKDGLITAINVSERPAVLSLCYSAGNLVSNGGPELVPLCSETMEVQMPPFGTRRIAVERDGNSWFSLRASGESVVLEMLRPMDAHVKLYRAIPPFSSARKSHRLGGRQGGSSCKQIRLPLDNLQKYG